MREQMTSEIRRSVGRALNYEVERVVVRKPMWRGERCRIEPVFEFASATVTSSRSSPRFVAPGVRPEMTLSQLEAKFAKGYSSSNNTDILRTSRRRSTMGSKSPNVEVTSLKPILSRSNMGAR